MIKNRNIPLKTISLFLVSLIMLLPNISVYGLVGSYSEKSDATGGHLRCKQHTLNEKFTYVNIEGFLGTITFSNFTDASSIGTSALFLKISNPELIKCNKKNYKSNNFSKFDN